MQCFELSYVQQEIINTGSVRQDNSFQHKQNNATDANTFSTVTLFVLPEALQAII